MKKLLILLMSILLCLPAMAETPAAVEAPSTVSLDPFILTLPQGVTLSATPGDASVTLIGANGTTRVIALAISRVPDEAGDHAAGLQQLMLQFTPGATGLTPLTLAPGFHGLATVTPGALDGMNGQKVDQATVMILWQTDMRGELLILSGYDMAGDTASVQALIGLLLETATVEGAPVTAPAGAVPAP